MQISDLPKSIRAKILAKAGYEARIACKITPGKIKIPVDFNISQIRSSHLGGAVELFPGDYRICYLLEFYSSSNSFVYQTYYKSGPDTIYQTSRFSLDAEGRWIAGYEADESGRWRRVAGYQCGL